MAVKVQHAYPEKADHFEIKSFYVVLNNCYQVGVFISRSSLQYVKIKKIWMLSFFQAINFVFLFLNTRFMWIDSLYILCPLFIWVGLMGGAAYVNVMHQILERKTLKKSEKEAAIAVSLIFNDVGVLLSAIFSLLIDNTLFATDKI